MGTRIKAIFFSSLVLALGIAYFIWGDLLSFETIKANQYILQSYAHRHYLVSVLIFLLLLISTAFFVPAALVLSLLGGFLFGTIPAIIYIDTGMTLGATLAFLSARHALGRHIQKKFGPQLRSFNDEIGRHGSNYMATLRIIPLMPFFAINYLAAMTKMSLARFIISTAIGILPGAAVHAYVGEQLSALKSPKGLITPKMILALSFMALLAILPVIISQGRRLRNKRSKNSRGNPSV
ncbi:MAG: TVP38/TMEM64 family protein [Syntrophorhabdus sp.]